MRTKTPIAFLLVRFDGSPAEPMTKAAADEMFTAAGRGTMNLVDWFDDNTHGHVDMSGNAVFGWLELDETLQGYIDKCTNGTYGRTRSSTSAVRQRLPRQLTCPASLRLSW